MPSLADKLKALGVKVGAAEVQPSAPRRASANEHLAVLEQVLSGHSIHTPQGDSFLIEARYPASYRHGRTSLASHAPRAVLAKWAHEPLVADLPLEAFAFFDTETTGLAGGTGTYAFLVGVGRFEGDEFHLAQYFMQDPIFEPGLLAGFEEFLAPCQAIVSFNGKTFDAPLLNTRYLLQGWRSPLLELAHVDLLHLARRLWRDRLAKRALGDLEVNILGAVRSEDDIPGWLIPQIYMQFLRDNDAEPLRRVVYHNAMDVLSLAALFNHTSQLLAEPFTSGAAFGTDLIALGRLFEDLDYLETATRLYLHGLQHSDAQEQRMPKEAFIDAIQRLAMIYKHQENMVDAIQLWEQAARHNHLESHLELAKYYEHWQKSYPEAIRWTLSAIDLVQNHQYLRLTNTAITNDQKPVNLIPNDSPMLPNLEHRLLRLQQKLAKATANDTNESSHY